MNADILLLSDFTEAASRAAAWKPRFLMVGQRWDLDVTEPLAFGEKDWERDLRARVERSGALHPPSGSDYFVYPRAALGALPPFAVGRPGWDNWMIYHARGRKMPVVDATGSTLVIHQNHAYRHVKQGTGLAWEGPEGDRNLELIGGNELAILIGAGAAATWGAACPSPSVEGWIDCPRSFSSALRAKCLTAPGGTA